MKGYRRDESGHDQAAACSPEGERPAAEGGFGSGD
jgi:hypothetical protein